MLFCLLHPMDHNTGPLARKSTTLCALLLVSISALLVLAVPEQATVEEVGVAKHILDGDSVTLNAVSKLAGKNLTYAEYKKHFPTVCNFFINETYIELLYDGKGCTVELITDKMDMIKLTTGVYLKKAGCKLDDFSKFDSSFQHGFSNLLPFAYSRTNKELKNLSDGPIYEGDNCEKKEECKGCMKHTFLEVSWNRAGEVICAHTHLIGEATTGLDQNKTGGETEFNLMIHSTNSFRMEFNIHHQTQFDTKNISCAPRGNAIPKPATWKLKNGVGNLEGKHLLVFHLLPQTASIRYEGGNHKGKLGEGRPKCDLFIRLYKSEGYVGFLQVDPQTTTTSTTTTATTTTTNPDATSPPAEKTSTSRPQQETTTKAATTTTTATKEGSKIWIWAIVFFVVFSVCLLIAAGAYRGYIIYEDQQKKKQEAEKQEAEDQLQRTYWLNAGDDDAIEDQNNKRVTADITTSTTTTATTTTTNPDATSPPAEKTSTSRPQQETTTKAATTTTTATKEGSKIWIWAIVFFVVFSVCLLIAAGAYRGYIIYEDQQKKKQEAEKQEAEDQLQRTYWLNAGDDDAIEDQNNKRVTADMPLLEDQFVNEIFDRMKKEDSENAAMNKKMLFELYLPALRDKGFEVVGTFNEWKKKSGLIQEKGETLKEFNAKVEKTIVNQSKAAERKKTKDDKAKKDKTPKDPASKKDPAPDKSDAARSKQAGTTSDIPTDMMSEAKGTDK
uniref:Uncharacterized protein n=1 Tax=Meloidogyne incognita TaxID=6306 RepID=A0A914KNG9_MELIC